VGRKGPSGSGEKTTSSAGMRGVIASLRPRSHTLAQPEKRPRHTTPQASQPHESASRTDMAWVQPSAMEQANSWQ